MRTRVALVDDHLLVARTLKAYLESFPEFTVVGTASTGEELLERLDEWQPDVILQDLLLPGGIDGIETTRRVLARRPSVRVVALTASLDEGRMAGVLRVGAAGYVRKDSDPAILLDAVRAVARGQTYIDPAVDRTTVRRLDGDDELTPRERDVLREIVRGRSNRDIALALDIGEETVKSHVTHVLAKLGVENRAQAVALALRSGLAD
jgi:DNA-binding NarL/FixJ family response regulator